jgi:hypothetical protein
MNSKRTVTVAKAVPIVFAQRERNATRMVWLRAIAVEANATSVVEGRGRNVTTGGRRRVRYQTQGQLDSHSWRRHTPYEAKATAATEGRRSGMQRRGRNQIVRRSARRGGAAVTYRQRHANTEHALHLHIENGVVVTWLEKGEIRAPIIWKAGTQHLHVGSCCGESLRDLPATPCCCRCCWIEHAR